MSITEALARLLQIRDRIEVMLQKTARAGKLTPVALQEYDDDLTALARAADCLQKCPHVEFSP